MTTPATVTFETSVGQLVPSFHGTRETGWGGRRVRDLVGSQWAFGIKLLFERRLLCWVLRTVEGDVSSLLPLSSRDRVSGCSPDFVVSD